MDGSTGERISGDRPDMVAGLGDARGLSREAVYVGLVVPLVMGGVPAIRVTIGTDAMLPGGGRKPRGDVAAGSAMEEREGYSAG